jgi:hypothetical protein
MLSAIGLNTFSRVSWYLVTNLAYRVINVQGKKFYNTGLGEDI